MNINSEKNAGTNHFRATCTLHFVLSNVLEKKSSRMASADKLIIFAREVHSRYWQALSL
jgi:hypothetical protein